MAHQDGELLADLPVLFVGVRCPPGVVAERERERGDRLAGLAVWQSERMQVGTIYDLEVDSSALTTAECAKRIARLVEHPPPVRGFEKMRRARAG